MASAPLNWLLKIGSDALQTTAQTISAAINELNANLGSIVSVSKTGTASSSAFRKQVITIDNVSTDIDGSAYMEQSVTLSTSAATTVTFTNAAIDDGAMLTVATSLWNLVPDDITLASGSCTIMLPKWATAETIGVRLYVR